MIKTGTITTGKLEVMDVIPLAVNDTDERTGGGCDE